MEIFITSMHNPTQIKRVSRSTECSIYFEIVSKSKSMATMKQTIGKLRMVSLSFTPIELQCIPTHRIEDNLASHSPTHIHIC